MNFIKRHTLSLFFIAAALFAPIASAASLVYNSFLYDVVSGSIVKTDTFKCILTTSAYTEDRDTHMKRSDVTNEVTGTGYTAGGNTVVPTFTKDTANDRLQVVIPTTIWTSSTITARKMACYKSRGGASSADELVFVNDFGADVITTAGTFTVNSSTINFNTP